MDHKSKDDWIKEIIEVVPEEKLIQTLRKMLLDKSLIEIGRNVLIDRLVNDFKMDVLKEEFGISKFTIEEKLREMGEIEVRKVLSNERVELRISDILSTYGRDFLEKIVKMG